MPYRSRHNTFTQEQYDRRARFFCAIPAAWGRLPGPTMLERMRRAGGSGAVSIYPVLAPFAHAPFASQVRYAKEEIARLTGRNVRTVRRGARALAKLGLITETQAWYRQQPITQWSVQPQIVAARQIGSRFEEDYFYFSSRLIYGGAWSRLTAIQQAIFLAVGTNGFTLHEPPTDSFWLESAVQSGTDLADLEDCYRHICSAASTNRRLGDPFVRVAVLSYAQLASITGISPSAIKRAVKQLKHPDVWPDSRNNRHMLRFSPLSVYPVNGGALLYHIRDHAPHWDWDELNQDAHPTAAMALEPGAADAWR